jgi:hypothetical protein
MTRKYLKWWFCNKCCSRFQAKNPKCPTCKTMGYPKIERYPKYLHQ